MDGGAHIALLLQQLRALTDSFPGERVLLADAPSQPDPMLESGLQKYAQLTASAPIGLPDTNGSMPTVAELRTEWMADLGNTTGDGTANTPLLRAVRVPAITDPAQRLAMERALAVMLLASRSAVVLEYGQELGLDDAAHGLPLMQWTATNLTRKAPPPEVAAKAAPSPNAGYGGFLPYVRPLPRNLFPEPGMPVVVESDIPTPEALALLPGFTTGDVDQALEAPNGATANVVAETYEPGSLLNLYKQLIRLHHDNATVRSGAQTVVNRDDLGALVWVRRAPASSRTSSTVVVACNLSNAPVVLGDLGVPTASFMRSLLHPAPGDLLKVEPGAVMVGETR